MRILLDECVNTRVKDAFQGQDHLVRTVSETSRRGSKDGPLLAHAEKSYDVFVTFDRKLERQHDLTKLPLGTVVVRVPSNEIASYRPIFPALLSAAASIKAGQVVHVQ